MRAPTLVRDGYFRGTVFYGWIIVAVVALLLSATSGARFAFGVFLKPLSEGYGWDRASLALAISINLVVAGLLNPAAGWAVDRYGAKPVGMLGALLLGVALAGLSISYELWHFYVLYGVVAAGGVSLASTSVSAKLIGAWFLQRRGTALSLSSSGIAIGQLLVVPAATLMLVTFSWRVSSLFLAGLILLIVLPLGLWLLRETPADMGAQPDGERKPASAASIAATAAAAADGLGIREVIRNPTFWKLGLGMVACGVTMSFPSTHFMPFATDLGMMELEASATIGLAGVISLPGAIVVGLLADRYGRIRLLSLMYVLRAVTYVFLLLAHHNPALIVAGAVVLGLSWTSTVPLTSALIADYFGRRSLGQILGWLVMAMWMASGITAYLSGLIYDEYHNYHLALGVSVVIAGVAAIAVLSAARTPRPPPTVAEDRSSRPADAAAVSSY